MTATRRLAALVAVVLCALMALALSAAPAFGFRALLDPELIQINRELAIPPPEADIEGACGLAVVGGSLYVSDYYHRLIDVFSLGGTYSSQIHLAGGAGTGFGINSLDSVCGLAADASGHLYANEWHEGVERLLPSALRFDSNESTGVAVDSATGNVYVDDRTYVAVYEPSGAEALDGEGHPLRIGLGSLEDGYGVAVAGGKVYVPDAGDDTVKVYEPSNHPATPVTTIAGPGGGHFVSLVDAAVTVDPTTGHLLLVDNLQPGFEHPRSAIYEFEASGAFLNQLPTAPSGRAPIDGEPSGIAVDPSSGDLFVTDGNGEESNVFEYGPYSSSPPPSSGGAASLGGPVPQSLSAEQSTTAADSGGSQPALASEVTQHGKLRVAFEGKISPHALPRTGTAPIAASVGGEISTTDGSEPPQLRRLSIAINRFARFDYIGLPVCHLANIDPSTSAGALEACHSSLVGEGSFSANVKIPEQSPFPSEGKVLAFNGRLHGQPVILAHVFGTKPVPTSYILPFSIKSSRGTYGTTLEASLPQVTGDWGFVTGMTMTLNRRFTYHGRRHSYMSAGCPAPKGFPGAVFPFSHTSFAFAGGPTLSSTLTRSCKVR